MVGAVLNNLRRPDSGPPRKQLKIKFNDVSLLPGHAQALTSNAGFQVITVNESAQTILLASHKLMLWRKTLLMLLGRLFAKLPLGNCQADGT